MDWKLALTTFGIVFLAEIGDKRWRSDKLTHPCSDEVIHPFTPWGGGFPFQGVDGSLFQVVCGVVGSIYACDLRTSFQSWRAGRRRFTEGCRVIMARAMSSPVGSESKPQ